MKNIHFIIRTFGERTTNLVINEYNKRSIYPTIITGNPFSETLLRSYKNAIEEDREYTVMVDADMIPINGFSVDKLIDIINDKKCYEVHVSGHDIYFQCIRPIGLRIYKTSEMKKAINDIDIKSNRPESKILHSQGFYYENICMVTHGYQQYYKDLWRSALFIREKNSKEIIDKIVKKFVLIRDENIFEKILIVSALNGYEHPNRDCNEKEPIEYKMYDKIIEEQNLIYIENK